SRMRSHRTPVAFAHRVLGRRPPCLLRSVLRLPPSPTLFPYTTLFRSLALSARSGVPGRRIRSADAPVAGFRRPDEVRAADLDPRSEEHTSELQSRFDLVCRLLLDKKNILTESPHKMSPSISTTATTLP